MGFARAALVALVCVGVTSCSVNLPQGEALVTCASYTECPQGGACIGGYCAPKGSQCIVGEAATAQAAPDGTSCAAGGLSGVCHSGQCAVCGDGVTEPGEICDDGNTDNNDGCTQRCAPPACGDGYTQFGEECDDGNLNAGDGCTPTCTTNVCGDKLVNPGTEGCDDGNTNDNDGCTSTCQVTNWSASVIVGYGLNHDSTTSSFLGIQFLASDGGNATYIADAYADVIWRFDRVANRLTPMMRVDQTGGPTLIPEGTIAMSTNVGSIGGLAVRNNGDLYVGASLGTYNAPGTGHYSDDDHVDYTTSHPVVLRIDSNGVVHNVAGSGTACSSSVDDDCGNNMFANVAQLYQVTALAFDNDNNLLIGDYYTLWHVDLRTNIMTRILGDGYACTVAPCGEGGDARVARVSRVGGIVVDDNGGIVVSDSGTGRLLRVDPDSHLVTKLASTGLVFPKGLSRAPDGTIYVADRDAQRVFALSPNYQTLTPVVGKLPTCPATDEICDPDGVDNQLATDTTLNRPSAVLVDGDGSVLIGDAIVNRIRRLQGGNITLGIGTPKGSHTGVGVFGTSIGASSFTLDSQQRVMFGFNSQLMLLNPTTNLSEHVAGSDAGGCTSGVCGDGGSAVEAPFGQVIDVALDATGNVYFISIENQRVRKIDVNGNVSTFAGSDTACDGTKNCGTATTVPTQARFDSLLKIEVVGDALYTLEANTTARAVVRKISFTTGLISIIAGSNAMGAEAGTQPAANALFGCPFDIAAGPSGTLLIADALNCSVRQINGATISTFATGTTCTRDFSSCGWDACSPASYGDFLPTSVTTDAQGNVFVFDQASHSVRRYSGGAPQTVMGNGTTIGPIFGAASTAVSFAPDAQATFNGWPFSIVSSMQVDSGGNLYAFEWPNFALVKRDAATGFVSPVLVEMDDLASGPVAKARLLGASALARLGGDLLIASDGQVRRLTSQMSMLELAMGNKESNAATANTSGVAFYHPALGTTWGIAIDAADKRAFVSDGLQIYVLTTDDAVPWTIAPYTQGTGVGYADGTLLTARFDTPKGLAYANQRLLVADAGNHLVRNIDAAGNVTTIAGRKHLAGFAGDGGAATDAKLSNPSAVAAASDGSVYIADTDNNRVRRIAPNGVITTVLGDGRAENAASATSRTGAVTAPRGLRFDGLGNLWVTAGRAVHVVTSSSGTPPDGSTPSTLAYVTSSKDAFPSSIVACLVDVETGSDDAHMMLLDGCQGLVLELAR